MILVGEGIERLVVKWLGFKSFFEWIPAYLWLGIPTFFFGFGFFSRRFERQADIAGCRAMAAFLEGRGEPAAIPQTSQEREMSLLREGSFRFLGAMLKVSQLNGMDQNQWSWRQGRLQDRFPFS